MLSIDQEESKTDENKSSASKTNSEIAKISGVQQKLLEGIEKMKNASGTESNSNTPTRSKPNKNRSKQASSCKKSNQKNTKRKRKRESENSSDDSDFIDDDLDDDAWTSNIF